MILLCLPHVFSPWLGFMLSYTQVLCPLAEVQSHFALFFQASRSRTVSLPETVSRG